MGADDLTALARAYAELYDATRYGRETSPAERRARDIARRVLRQARTREEMKR